MEVHVGKYHSEKFECGLCEYEAENLENLETHLFTCEIFECNKCGLRGKSMKDIIKHGETEHPEYKSRWIDHIKMDRKNYTEVSTKGYWSDEI